MSKRKVSAFPSHNASSDYLRRKRAARNMTQADVAQAMGCSVRTVQRFERDGVQGSTRLTRIRTILKAYSIPSVNQLFFWMTQQA